MDSAWLPPEYRLAGIEIDRQPHWILLSSQEPSTSMITSNHLLGISALHPFADDGHLSMLCLVSFLWQAERIIATREGGLVVERA